MKGNCVGGDGVRLIVDMVGVVVVVVMAVVAVAGAVYLRYHNYIKANNSC